MMGKREVAARALDQVALVRPLTRLRRLVQPDLPVLAYHRVLELEDESRFPFDPELVSASPQNFRRQMRYIARHFTPIGLTDVLWAMQHRRQLPRDAIVVTFDDGYVDNYTQAFPVLRALRIPATIFVATGYLGSRAPFWYDRVAYALYRHTGDVVRVPGTEWRLRLDTMAQRRRSAVTLVEQLKRIPDLERRRHLDALATAIDMDIEPGELPMGCPMNWEQVREMQAAGIEFGSHTVSHPVLTRMDPAALNFELQESKRQLEAVLGGRVETLSYPFGGPEDYDDRVVAAARAAGYRLGASYIGGHNPRPVTAAFDLRRLHVERYTSMAMFASMLAVPQLFGRR